MFDFISQGRVKFDFFYLWVGLFLTRSNNRSKESFLIIVVVVTGLEEHVLDLSVAQQPKRQRDLLGSQDVCFWKCRTIFRMDVKNYYVSVV